jgi:hypothetical protein
MFNGKPTMARKQQTKGRSSIVRIQPAAWRRLSTWADQSGGEVGIATDLRLVIMLLLGTVLCFGLQGVLASYQTWWSWRSSSARLTNENQRLGRQAIRTASTARNGSVQATTVL